jgi:hypothetical protein
MFNYHCGTVKFDVKIFDGTQCQKKYAPVAWMIISRIKDINTLCNRYL